MGKGRHNIPTYHPPAPSTTTGGADTNTGGSANATQTSAATGGGPNSYQSMYAQQKKDAAKAAAKAANRNIAQAEVLQQQVLGLRKALGVHGFKHRLDLQLGNIDLRQATTDIVLMKGYHDRVASLDQSATDNVAAANDQTYANLANRGRERANAMGEATANGAGESDLLRAQSMSLSNWNSNQSDVNRSYYDSRTSINASLHDLNQDTYSARVNNAQQAGADRETAWQSYYDRKSESLTQLGNTLGQQAEYYGLANEQVGKKKWRQHQKSLGVASGQAYGQASVAAGGGYDDPGVSKKLMNWQGHDDFEGRLNDSKVAAAGTELAPKKPEGAGLRSWTG